ncbi:hypothetical protein K501DRAFT_278482 [Backusella circina FSU 941]|nr:hypothetical protein K501DRAFT_278482 [Backusella circina FSU 941]
MTFGTELKDQVPTILSHVGDGIHSLSQFRNFIKDKNAIEREYAQKLEHLTRKYKSASKQKLAENTTQDEWDWKDNSSLLNQTSSIAKGRMKLSDDINSLIVDSLRGLTLRKEDARKKHSAFYQKLKGDRDKTYAEKDKAKQLYDEACAEIENLKIKQSKTSGDQDKASPIGAANAERSKYFEEDIPRLADYLEELDGERINALKTILKCYVELEAKTVKSVEICHQDSLRSVETIDAAVDASVFIRTCSNVPDASERAANVDFHFLPWNGGVNHAEIIIDRDENLAASDSAVIYLNNRLIKDRKQLNILGDDLEKKSTEMNKLSSLVDSIENKTTVEYDKAKEKLLEVVRDVSVISTQKVKIKSEVDLIIQNIGDDGLKAQNHDFKSSSFAIPTTCDYCNNSIWGLSNKALTCRACGFNCHARCEMKVAPTCSRVKGQINPQPILPSPSIHSETRSTRTNSIIGSAPSTPIETKTSSPPLAFPSTTPTDHSTVSVAFIRAIYTYKAQNSDELDITEGDTLSILEGDDGSGWLKAQLGDAIGLVPANYIQYIDYNHPSPTESDHQEQPSPVSSPLLHEEEEEEKQETVADFTAPQTPTMEPEVVVALYDFEAVNTEELNIKQGDTIIVTKKDDSGWWEGTLNGHSGIFPANYVE